MMEEAWNALALGGSPVSVAVAAVLRCNAVTRRYGLTLNTGQARTLVQAEARALRRHGRVAFGGGAAEKLIFAFCDSPFLRQEEYAQTLVDLLETFYYFKGEMHERLSDDELIRIMRASFDANCGGSLELLQARELEGLARAIRAEAGWVDAPGGRAEEVSG